MSSVVDNNIIMPTDEAAADKFDIWLAKEIGADLLKQYPGRMWRVFSDCRGGIVGIHEAELHGNKGVLLKIGRNTVHDLQMMARRAAGEVLERFNVSRDKIVGKDYFADVERDARGDALE